MNNEGSWWKPSALELFQAQTVALTDPLPETCDAVFVHGSCMRDDCLDKRLLEQVLRLYQFGVTKKIILNSLTQEQIEQKGIVSYAGYEPWQEFFLTSGVAQSDIILMKPSWHTASEAVSLLELTEASGWSRLVIATQPWHILRCFLQVIATMGKARFWPDVYCLTHHQVSWDHFMKKGRLNGGMVVGNMLTHAESEFQNIEVYGNPPKVEGAHSQNATISEMFRYLTRRNCGKSGE